MGKILAFIYDDMADFELTFPLTVSGLWGEKEIVTIAYELDAVTSKPGIRYLPHMTVREALELSDVEGIIIPGGWRDEMRPELVELLTKLDNESKFLSAICAGPQYLARAGVIKDKRYTTTLSKSSFEEKGVDDPFNWDGFVDSNVVRDGNIITAKGAAFVDFAIEIGDYLGVFAKEEGSREMYRKMFKGLE